MELNYTQEQMELTSIEKNSIQRQQNAHSSQERKEYTPG